jgi:hypothetical protein
MHKEKRSLIRKVSHNGDLIAVYIPSSHGKLGVEFATDNNATMQVGVLVHPQNKIVAAHRHLPVQRESHITQEVLFVRKGVVRADLFNAKCDYLESILLKENDTLLLVSGGHGFEILEDADMVEVKTGPYKEDKDKERFEGMVPEKKIFNI